MRGQPFDFSATATSRNAVSSLHPRKQRRKMNEPFHCLLIEGVAALFGAGGLYLLVGLCFRIAGSPAPFAWREALAPLGWLYGALVIGIQTTVRLLNSAYSRPILATICIVTTVFCCVLLIAAMYLRGSQPGRPPSIWMKSTAGVIAVAILATGFFERGTS